MFSVGLASPHLTKGVKRGGKLKARRTSGAAELTRRRKAPVPHAPSQVVPGQAAIAARAAPAAAAAASGRAAPRTRRRPAPQPRTNRRPNREVLHVAEEQRKRMGIQRNVHVNRSGSIFISGSGGGGGGGRAGGRTGGASAWGDTTRRAGADEFEMDERGFPVLPDAVLRMRESVGAPPFVQQPGSSGAESEGSGSRRAAASRQRVVELGASTKSVRSPGRASTRQSDELGDWDWWRRHGDRPSTRRGTYFGLYPPGHGPGSIAPGVVEGGAASRRANARSGASAVDAASLALPMPRAPPRPAPQRSARGARGESRGSEGESPGRNAAQVAALLSKLRSMRAASEAEQARALLEELRAMQDVAAASPPRAVHVNRHGSVEITSASGRQRQPSRGPAQLAGAEYELARDGAAALLLDAGEVANDAVDTAVDAAVAAAFASMVAIAIAAAAGAVDIASDVARIAAHTAAAAAADAAAAAREAADARAREAAAREQEAAVSGLLRRRAAALAHAAFRAWVAKQQRAAAMLAAVARTVALRERKNKALTLQRWNRVLQFKKRERAAALAPCIEQVRVENRTTVTCRANLSHH